MTCLKKPLKKIKIGDGNHQYASFFYDDVIEKPLGVVGLNPSLFKKGRNATVSILMEIAKREGFDSLFITNLYSYISPDPKALKTVEKPVEEPNDRWIDKMIMSCDKVLCIWGNHGEDSRVNKIFPKVAEKAYAIGLTKSGRPRHVLHTKKSAKLIKL